MKTRIAIWVLLMSVLVGCGKRTIYSEFQSLPLSGWEADSALQFTIAIADTTQAYDVLLHVRHTQQYSYQNMWLFMESITPISSGIDTIEFYLANDRGQWLGSGWGNIRELSVPYMQQVLFPTSGEYTFRIHQGMREECLRGVNDMGLTVEISK